MSLSNLDPWLEPYHEVIDAREQYIKRTSEKVLAGKSVVDFALGFHYFGLHQTKDGWVFREWAPNATKIYLVGDFNDWREQEDYRLKPGIDGEWAVNLTSTQISHGDRYKLRLYWPGGSDWRIPSYAKRVVQDNESVDFAAEVWSPKIDYTWRNPAPSPSEVPLIYEAHVGMSSEEPKVSTFKEFTRDVLPRIKKAGYNTIQLMAVQEHPYYGSFGYHVSNFFAVSSRFGTPDDFKALVDEAHGLGLRIIIDIVHSHAVKNEAEGLSRFDGTLNQYFKGDHPAWDSRVFDYGKSKVLHFLLSNCRFWLDEYSVDGFRFDGVTSMLYTDHGLDKAFTGYDDYYQKDVVDKDALVYLRLANQLIHEVRPSAITVAEEMSGYPGLGAHPADGGLGFDYRLSMGSPDLWIKTFKEKSDEEWNLGEIVHTLNSHRPEEKVISYAESHDQALVGDKTLIFRLIDRDMYWHMQKDDENHLVERGVALHKMIRLLTIALHGGGYLNFMGNEFGHPEWIDFPRKGNGWSYQHARRQWSLADDDTLKYRQLGHFDQKMTALAKNIIDPDLHYLEIDEQKGLISFYRENYLFVFNFSPTESYPDQPIATFSGSYNLEMSTDDSSFGGRDRIEHFGQYFSYQDKTSSRVKVYVPARTAIVLRKID